MKLVNNFGKCLWLYFIIWEVSMIIYYILQFIKKKLRNILITKKNGISQMIKMQTVLGWVLVGVYQAWANYNQLYIHGTELLFWECTRGQVHPLASTESTWTPRDQISRARSYGKELVYYKFNSFLLISNCFKMCNIWSRLALRGYRSKMWIFVNFEPPCHTLSQFYDLPNPNITL